MSDTKIPTPDYSKLVQNVQEKAGAVYAKGSTLANEAVELAKGNAEALVESGKVLASGAQSLGRDYLAESRNAFDTLTADFKELAGIRSPVELLQLQSKVARRNFDQVVAFGSKNSETMIKLANEVFAPLSNRVSLAVEKITKNKAA